MATSLNASFEECPRHAYTPAFVAVAPIIVSVEFLSPVVAVKTFLGSSPPLNVHLSVAVLLASHVNVCCAPGVTVAVSGSTVILMAVSFASGGSVSALKCV